jgi:hypothetical protein
MSLFGLINRGLGPMGSLPFGLIAAAIGPPWTVAASGLDRLHRFLTIKPPRCQTHRGSLIFGDANQVPALTG